MPNIVRHSDYEEIGNNHQELCNKENVNLLIYGFKQKYLRLFLYHLVSLVLLGLPYVVLSWFPKYKVGIKSQKCNLQEATLVLISDNYGHHTVEQVQVDLSLKYFVYQHTKYVWLEDKQVFGQVSELFKPTTIEDYLNNTTGLSGSESSGLLRLYGKNKIEIEIKSYWQLFLDEVFHPFYIFQFFSILLWCLDDYMIYAGCVFVLTLFSTVTTLLETRKQSKALHDLVDRAKCHLVSVIRDGKIVFEDPEHLVPGDLIVLPRADFIMPCDCVLLRGQCIVNESMLTGESVPITKTAPTLTDEIFDTDLHKRHTLFSGTLMIQSRYYNKENVLARVLHTGFDTTKGSLIKSILYPTPVFLKFYKDSLKFVVFLFFLAGFGLGYSIYLYTTRNADLKDIIIRSLDIITIVVPPALPAALTVGIVYSQNRLKKLDIFCISPPRINICGKIKLTCFDKTGTLTHDGLNVHSVLPTSKKAQFLPQIHNDNNVLDNNLKWLQCMATCHSLTTIGGKLNGDPLDLAMFQFTKWQLEEPDVDENARFDLIGPTVVSFGDYQIGIVRQFPFSSNLQCMSVICRDLNLPNMMAFTKGAPEKLVNFCLQQTLPSDFYERLAEFTMKGYRVIALGYKELPVRFKWAEAQKVKRDFIECDLIFLGFLVMQNPLKQESEPIINTLHEAYIRSVMITGDNLLTAIAVARDCGMVKENDEITIIEINSDCELNPRLSLQHLPANSQNNVVNFNSSHCHFAVDGKTWTKLKEYFPDLLANFLVKTTIFARFQPDQKTQLIGSFQKLDYVVAMVGDGANDCGALKAAHVGVSLSQAEASVAAPFTSKIENISCIVHLMLEGRCALVTSFAVFKYMALYSLIQFFTVLILYKQHSILGDTQFLYIDLIITTALSVTIGLQGPSSRLCRKRPMGSLVSAHNLLPMILQVFFCGLIQLCALFFLFNQRWYKPPPDKLLESKEEIVLCWEDTVLFTVSCFQYIILACAYSKGWPYRQNLCKNFWFLVSVLLLTGFCFYLMVFPTKIIADFFELVYVSMKDHEKLLFKYELLMFPFLHLIIAFFIENFVANTVWLKKVLRCVTRKKKPKNRFKLLLQESEDFLVRLNRFQ